MASEDMTLDRLWEIVKGLQQQSSVKYTRVDLPTTATVQGRPSLISNMQPKTVTVPDMRNYDFISISYHHDSTDISNTECQLIPIYELRVRGTIKFFDAWQYFQNPKCYLTLKYENDTTLVMTSGDATISGIFSPMYFIKF